uniref:Uncharacterized protein n=1 Tax=Anguilla anguilla TaxID=7936 RepID=A0A0E9PMQ1_ANGAN
MYTANSIVMDFTLSCLSGGKGQLNAELLHSNVLNGEHTFFSEYFYC